MCKYHCKFPVALALAAGLIISGGTGAADGLSNIAASLPATDSLGRKLPTYEEVGAERPGKFVALFYWTWHMNFINHPPHNVADILAENPEALRDYYHPAWPKPKRGEHHYFFWDEPLFGYYRNTDKWVLRRHAEMLADAGVDVIFFDCTNGHFTWKESYIALCEEFMEARKQGTKTPQIAFLLALFGTEGSRMALEELYTELYKPGLYRDLWFQWEGKPLIMAYPETLVDLSGNDTSATLHAEIREFFTFRPGQPVYDTGPQRPDHWGWLQIYPQHGFVELPDGKFEQMPVGVAQNWNKQQGLTAMNAPETFGRSYTHTSGTITDPGAVNYGYNFQEQWDRVLQVDPQLVFITGWNEWVAHRFKKWGGVNNAFPDQFSQEYSRDIEPMKGGHGDNYYYQMISNIRRFKGMPKPPPVSEHQSISIDGKFDEWKTVEPEFQAHKGNAAHRDSPGWRGSHYINTTGRNDIALAKAASDNDNLFFLVQTVDPLTSASDPAWMRLFIDVDRNKDTGWEGYDYVINRSAPGKTASLDRSIRGWNWEPAGTVPYAVNANSLEIQIPKKMVGLSPGESINLEFKWSDNMQNEGHVMDFLLNGDVAPAGRFNYMYSEKPDTN